MHHYIFEIRVCQKDRALACDAVQEFLKSLFGLPESDVPMAKPMIELSGYKITCRDFSEEPNGHVVLDIDIAALTGGMLDGITRRQLASLLFNSEVYKNVSLAMIDVLHWTSLIEEGGNIPFSEGAVLEKLVVIMEAISASIEKKLGRAPRH